MDPSKFKKATDYEWIIPQTEGMRVPGKIFSTEELIRGMDDKVWEQLSNVACLPGIQKFAIGMPDAHWGYGFPIGGIAAFDPKEDGVISVGGVGFDINCLHPQTTIVDEYGISRKICELESVPIANAGVYTLSLACARIRTGKGHGQITFYTNRNYRGQLLKIKTLFGKELTVTPEHPILTPAGFVRADELKIGDGLLIDNFEGVEGRFSEETIIELEDRELEEKGLARLKYDAKGAILARAFGYLLGDGYIGKKKICAYGRLEDLELLAEDFKKLGYSPKIYIRRRSHKIKTKYSLVQFERDQAELQINSVSLIRLFRALGYPVRPKSIAKFRIPDWIRKGPAWIKRAFLSGLFSAELSKPSFMRNGCTPYIPTFTQMKNECVLEQGHKFLEDIADLLHDLGIKIRNIKVERYHKNRFGPTWRLKLFILEEPDNLIRLYSKIGFDYCKYKAILANFAIAYLRFKKQIIELREKIRRQAKVLGRAALNKFDEVNRRFIERSIYSDTTQARVPKDFPSFKDFILAHNFDGLVRDKIVKIEKIPYSGKVYDLTIDPQHRFVANGIVVSNCGVRVLKTNLTAEQVRPKIRALMDALFKTIPAGLGSRGEIRLSRDQVDEVMVRGAPFIVDLGYGEKEDLEYTEEGGCVKGANPQNVSETAIKRERGQVGTLGSGNHYLEVQWIDQIMDKQAADAFGLQKDQVVIAIHCGSRALGHQIGTDYLKILADAVRKYGLKIRGKLITELERELVCAPIESVEGQKYYSAMVCGINYAFANRQVITHLARKTIKQVFPDAEIHQLYDIGHNTCKIERHQVDGQLKELYVHRKGATRAFGPGRQEVPVAYRSVGQPVLIGGTMGTHSYILVGTEYGTKAAWGSACHGAGRRMSRTKAKKMWWGSKLLKELEAKGVIVRAHSMSGLAEEAPGAYKAVEKVVDGVVKAQLAKYVALCRPMGCIKG